MSIYTRLATPIRTGECYRNGMSCYKVLEAMPSIGEAILCRPSDGWTLLAHGAALYDTADGEQLMWDYSTRGRFVEDNRAHV